MSSRICAWIVTSSAVVGSSAISSVGIAGERHRDHDALAHAARQPMRIFADALLRVRNVHARQHLHRMPLRGPVAEAAMQPHHLGDLLADGQQRVEADIGSWKIMPISLPRTRRIAGSVRRSRSRMAPARSRNITLPPAMSPGGIGTRRMMESAVTDLPLPDLADQRQRLAAADVETHTVDRARDLGRARNQVCNSSNCQQFPARGSGHVSRRNRGSSASRNPSPTICNDNTVSAMQSPGARMSHCACCMYC